MSAITAIVQIWRERVQKAVWGGTCLGSPVACWVFVAAEPNYPAFPSAEERGALPLPQGPCPAQRGAEADVMGS